jgi:hypothetical protein
MADERHTRGPIGGVRKRRRLTADELIWLAYSRVPAELRLCASFEAMPEAARAVWLEIAKRNLAAGGVAEGDM